MAAIILDPTNNTYVLIATQGAFDDREETVIYAGESLVETTKAYHAHRFESDYRPTFPFTFQIWKSGLVVETQTLPVLPHHIPAPIDPKLMVKLLDLTSEEFAEVVGTAMANQSKPGMVIGFPDLDPREIDEVIAGANRKFVWEDGDVTVILNPVSAAERFADLDNHWE